jgi:hypothetical protein
MIGEILQEKNYGFFVHLPVKICFSHNLVIRCIAKFRLLFSQNVFAIF